MGALPKDQDLQDLRPLHLDHHKCRKRWLLVVLAWLINAHLTSVGCCMSISQGSCKSRWWKRQIKAGFLPVYQQVATAYVTFPIFLCCKGSTC